jgi:hypothetical protein
MRHTKKNLPENQTRNLCASDIRLVFCQSGIPERKNADAEISPVPE